MSRRACLTLVVVLAAAGCGNGADPVTFPTASTSGVSAPKGSTAPVSPPPASSGPSSGASSEPAPNGPARETIATGLPVPWGLAFLPDGSALVTLRDQGEVLRIARGSAPLSVGRVPGVEPDGEGGLLGIAVSPAFASDRTVFAYFTARDDNRVMRMTFDGTTLRPGPAIVKDIAKAGNHDGGRLAFGPDGFLYISTGDAGLRDPAQDRGSLNGKILRVTKDGAPAPGNPFPGSRVWSLGHRNVQGMAWTRSGAMYASEFGQNTWDELNRIEPGRNYGWPVVEGIAHRAGFVDPIHQWPTADASPSGIAVGGDGAVYMAALRGESLWRIPLDSKGGAGTAQRLLQGQYGRLRTIVPAPDGRLWLVTSNTFRGSPHPGDDRIVALRLPVR
jgi:glucose/arabinose dehydrogenase